MVTASGNGWRLMFDTIRATFPEGLAAHGSEQPPLISNKDSCRYIPCCAVQDDEYITFPGFLDAGG
jgi:hypothetical protein